MNVKNVLVQERRKQKNEETLEKRMQNGCFSINSISRIQLREFIKCKYKNQFW